jgi:hypothetical protein
MTDHVANQRSTARVSPARSAISAELAGQPTQIYCRNVSTDGLSFECNRELDLDRVIPFTVLQSPPKPSFEFNIRVIWKSSVAPDKHTYGCEFVNSDAANLLSIIKMLQGTNGTASPKYYQRALTIMQEATVVPRDRRRFQRRQDNRRGPAADEAGRPGERRSSYRRSQFDRRGIIGSFMSHQDPAAVFQALSDFSNWRSSREQFLTVRESLIDDKNYCLAWKTCLEEVPIHWRSLARVHKNTKTILLELLDGDLDVFSGRVWIEPVGTSTRVNFNFLANFEMGTFERLVGPVFKARIEEIFLTLISELQKRAKGEL